LIPKLSKVYYVDISKITCWLLVIILMSKSLQIMILGGIYYNGRTFNLKYFTFLRNIKPLLLSSTIATNLLPSTEKLLICTTLLLTAPLYK